MGFPVAEYCLMGFPVSEPCLMGLGAHCLMGLGAWGVEDVFLSTWSCIANGANCKRNLDLGGDVVSFVKPGNADGPATT